MRVLVTGGAGFIGSNLVDLLSSRGDTVLVVDDLSTGSRDNLPPGVELAVMDILDPELPVVMSGFSPDGVVHLAAQTSVAASVEDPERDRRLNVDGTRAVARAATAADAGRLLMASSAAVYGDQPDLPIPETSRVAPANPYGLSKLAAEAVLVAEAHAAGSDAANLRLSNVYGPRQSAQGEGGVVAVFCSGAVAGDDLVLHGDGSQTRDFIFVGDVVRAFAAGLDSEQRLVSSGPNGPVFNVSTGIETSVIQVADAVEAAVELPIGRHSGPERPGDVPRSALDPSVAAEVLAWRATTSFADGIGQTVAWFREARGA